MDITLLPINPPPIKLPLLYNLQRIIIIKSLAPVQLIKLTIRL